MDNIVSYNYLNSSKCLYMTVDRVAMNRYLRYYVDVSTLSPRVLIRVRRKSRTSCFNMKGGMVWHLHCSLWLTGLW
jgi:hypothetical protein